MSYESTVANRSACVQRAGQMQSRHTTKTPDFSECFRMRRVTYASVPMSRGPIFRGALTSRVLLSLCHKDRGIAPGNDSPRCSRRRRVTCALFPMFRGPRYYSSASRVPLSCCPVVTGTGALHRCAENTSGESSQR